MAIFAPRLMKPLPKPSAVLMASLPPAATIYVVATQYNTYVQRASSAILIGTAVSVFTVTGVLYVITQDLLP